MINLRNNNLQKNKLEAVCRDSYFRQTLKLILHLEVG